MAWRRLRPETARVPAAPERLAPGPVTRAFRRFEEALAQRGAGLLHLRACGVVLRFRRVEIGLRGASDRHGPRLHDLRHRFATNTLVNWYRGGQDPARRLPLLSAYLGHVHVADTQWYLEASPELMREAMCRLEQCWEDRS